MSFCTKLVQHSRAILNTQINDFVLNMILVDGERQVIQRHNFLYEKTLSKSRNSQVDKD